MPKALTVHIIADNYSTHKHAKVKAWLERHKRFEMHFTPTSSSWMNLVERFFADVTEDCVRAGSFASVKELTDAITSYLAERNKQPRPYKWKASGKEILAKIQRAREALAEVQGKLILFAAQDTSALMESRHHPAANAPSHRLAPLLRPLQLHSPDLDLPSSKRAWALFSRGPATQFHQPENLLLRESSTSGILHEAQLI